MEEIRAKLDTGTIHKRKVRTNFVVERNFQFKYTLILAAAGAVISVFYGWVVWTFIERNYNFLLSFEFTNSPQIVSQIRTEQRFLFLNLIFICLFLVLVVSGLGVVITHRMAGPVFVLKKKLKALTEGDYTATLKLRRGDEFHNLQEIYNAMVVGLQEETRDDIDFADDCLSRVSNKKIDEAAQLLVAFKTEKEAHLGGPPSGS
jgi:methyl-accepting chemotaxis protein